MGELKFIGGIMLVVIFSIAVISYVANFSSDNSAEVTISDDSSFDALNQDLQNNVTLFSQQTNTSAKAFYDSTIASGDSTTTTGGQFKVGLGTSLTTIQGILSLTKNKIFGGSPAFGYVLTAILSFLLYSGVRYVWKTWKGGDPD